MKDTPPLESSCNIFANKMNTISYTDSYMSLRILMRPSQRKLLINMKILHFYLVLLLAALLSFTTATNGDCVYTVYVKTGSIVKAGTDSKISLTLGDSIGNSFWISDLKDWGLMGRKHDYFERGNTDIFSGQGPCIGSPVCRLNVTSDGSGAHHGWFCDSIEVTSAGPHRKCGNSEFYVDRWLAHDAPPYRLWAVLDRCLREAQLDSGPLVV